MSTRSKRRMNIIAIVILLALVASPVMLLAASVMDVPVFGAESAYASDYGTRSGSAGGDTYYHFNPANIFDVKGESANNKGVMGGFVEIIDFIITKIALPIGIIMSTWRVLYLAIFPLIIGSDPLNMTGSGRYKGVRKGNADSQSEMEDNWRFQNNPAEAWRSYQAKSGPRFETQPDKHENMTTSNTGTADFRTSTSWANKLGGDKMENNVSKYIIHECKFMFFGLLITFIAWGLVKLLLTVSVLFLNMADSAATNMVS